MSTRNHNYYSKSIPYNHIYHKGAGYIITPNNYGSTSEFTEAEENADEDVIEVPEEEVDSGITEERDETDNSIEEEYDDRVESFSEMEARQLSYASLPTDSQQSLSVYNTRHRPLSESSAVSVESVAENSNSESESDEGDENDEVENVSSVEESSESSESEEDESAEEAEGEEEEEEFVNVKVRVEKDPYAIYNEAVKVTVSVQPPSEVPSEVEMDDGRSGSGSDEEESRDDANQSESGDETENVTSERKSEKSDTDDEKEGKDRDDGEKEDEEDDKSSDEEEGVITARKLSPKEQKTDSVSDLSDSKTEDVGKMDDNKIDELLNKAIKQCEKIKSDADAVTGQNIAGSISSISTNVPSVKILETQGVKSINEISSSVKQVGGTMSSDAKNVVANIGKSVTTVGGAVNTTVVGEANKILENSITKGNEIISKPNLASNVTKSANDVGKALQTEIENAIKTVSDSVKTPINANIVKSISSVPSPLVPAAINAATKFPMPTKTTGLPSKTNMVTQVATVMVHRNPPDPESMSFIKRVIALQTSSSTSVTGTITTTTSAVGTQNPTTTATTATTVDPTAKVEAPPKQRRPLRRIVTSADDSTRLTASVANDGDMEDYLTIFDDSDDNDTSEAEDDEEPTTPRRKQMEKEYTEEEKKALEVEKDKLLQEWKASLHTQHSVEDLDEKFAQILEDMSQELQMDPVAPKLPKKLKEVIKDREPEPDETEEEATSAKSSASTVKSLEVVDEAKELSDGEDDDDEDKVSIKSEDIQEGTPGSETLQTAKLLEKYAKAAEEEAKLALEKEKALADSLIAGGSKPGSGKSQKSLQNVSIKQTPKLAAAAVSLSRKNSIVEKLSPKSSPSIQKSGSPNPQNSLNSITLPNSGALKSPSVMQKSPSPSQIPKPISPSNSIMPKTPSQISPKNSTLNLQKPSTSSAAVAPSSSSATMTLPQRNSPPLPQQLTSPKPSAMGVATSANKFQRQLSNKSLTSKTPQTGQPLSSSAKTPSKPPLTKTASQSNLITAMNQNSPGRLSNVVKTLSRNSSIDSFQSVSIKSPSLSRQTTLQTEESIDEEKEKPSFTFDNNDGDGNKSLNSLNVSIDREEETPSPSRRRKWKTPTEIAHTLSHYLYIVKTETIEECIQEIIPLLTLLLQLHRKYAAEHDLPTLIAGLSSTKVFCERLHHVKIMSGESALRNVDLSWLIRVLCKISAHPDSKVKPEAAFTLARLVKAAGPELITRPIYFLLVMENEGRGSRRGAQGSKTKAAALDTLTYALLTFPKDDFYNLEEIAGWVCLVTLHPHRRVRQAALECIAVLGHCIGSPDAAIDQFRRHISKETEANRGRPDSAESEDGSPRKKAAIRTFDGKGVFDVSAQTAISSRIFRRILPIPSPKGLIEYGVKVPTGQELVVILTKMQEKEEEAFEVSTSDESIKSSNSMEDLFLNSQAESEAESIRMSDIEKAMADETKTGIKPSKDEDDALAAAKNSTDLITPDVAYILAGKGRVNKQDVGDDEENLKETNASLDAEGAIMLKQLKEHNQNQKDPKKKRKKRRKKRKCSRCKNADEDFGSSEDDIF